jgi:hypothetical protein
VTRSLGRGAAPFGGAILCGIEPAFRGSESDRLWLDERGIIVRCWSRTTAQ